MHRPAGQNAARLSRERLAIGTFLTPRLVGAACRLPKVTARRGPPRREGERIWFAGSGRAVPRLDRMPRCALLTLEADSHGTPHGPPQAEGYPSRRVRLATTVAGARPASAAPASAADADADADVAAADFTASAESSQPADASAAAAAYAATGSSVRIDASRAAAFAASAAFRAFTASCL